MSNILKTETPMTRPSRSIEAQSRKALAAQLGGEEVIETADPIRPSPPILPRKLLSDIMIEGVLRHYEEGDPSIGIFADEGGQFFGGAGMGRDNQLKTAAGLSKLWDAAPVNRTRAGTPQVTFHHRRASLHLMIQPRIAEEVLRNEVLRDQGLLSRTLIARPESRIGHRTIYLSEEEAEKQKAASRALARFHSRITALLRLPRKTGATSLELAPQCLPLAPDARTLLVTFANQVEHEQRPYGPLAHITGFASKAAEQVARIAGIFTLMQDETAILGNKDTVFLAIQVVTWHLAEAQRLLDTGYVDPTLERAETLRHWLNAHKPSEAFDKRSLVRCGPSKIRDTKTIARLLEVLVQPGHVVPLPPGTEVDGKPVQQVWRLR